MPIFRITDPDTGQELELEGESPPTAQELETIFSSTPSQAQPAQSEAKPSFFESPMARILFPGVGQAVGTAAGVGLGAAAGGVGTVPGGLVGAGTGAGVGEATRQLLAKLTGGGPRTTREAIMRPIEEAAIGVAGEGFGPILKAGGKAISRAVPPTVARVGQLITRVSSDAIRRAIARGPKTVLDPKMITSEIQPETVDKVVNGLKAFRTESQKAYNTAVSELEPIFKDREVGIKGLVDNFRKKLVDSKVITQAGDPIKPILVEATQVSRTNNQLTKILNRLATIAEKRGGKLSANEAIRLRKELDTLIDFDPNDIKKISKEGQRLLKALRVSLKESIDEAVPEMKPINDEYHAFIELYDSVQPQLRDRNIESTILRLQSGKNRFTFNKLAEINSQIDPEFQFINLALDDLASQAFSKEPELFSVLPLSMGGALGFKFGPLGGLVGLMGGAQMTSGKSLAGGLRGAQTASEIIEKLTRPIGQAIAPTQPVQGTAVSSILRFLGLSRNTSQPTLQ